MTGFSWASTVRWASWCSPPLVVEISSRWENCSVLDSDRNLFNSALGDGLVLGVSLGLDRPQVSVGVLGHQVDARLGVARAVRPLLPQPDAAQAAACRAGRW